MCKNAILEQLVTIYNKSTFSSNDIATIISCSQNDNPEIRAVAAELLVNVDEPISKKILTNLTGDTDDLVRANACDSLCIFDNDDDILQLLFNI